MLINPGTLPIEQASEDLAAANLALFLDEVRAQAAELEQVPIRRRVAHLADEPVREPASDRDGRFAWRLPFSDGRAVRVLMPGVALNLIRDDLTAAAPCLYVDDNAWWWSGAVGSVAGEGMTLVEGILPTDYAGRPGTPGSAASAPDAAAEGSNAS